jgi:DNA-binding IclR family transcriptional regulator
VRNAVAVLRCFSPQEPALGVNEIARRVGLDRSTVSRLLQTMVELGLVAKDGASGSYRLGLGLVELAGTALVGLNIRTVARDEMHQLNRALRETVNLAILDLGEAVIIEHLPSPEPIGALGWVGRRHPAYCTAVGKALLAHAGEPVVAAVLAGPLRAYTPQTVTDPVRVRRDLADVRARGYAVNRMEFQDALHGVAAPVFDHRGQVAAALGVAGPAYRLTEPRIQEIGDIVAGAAARLSRQLGAPRHLPHTPRPDPGAPTGATAAAAGVG